MLPFFHSFGFTVTIWLPLVGGCGAVYHPNPTDAKAIGELVAEIQRGTFLLSTPTFCSDVLAQVHAKKNSPSLRYVLVGAEKLREPVAAAFREKFGVELLEGYGCTEMSPVVAVNTPEFRSGPRHADRHQAGHRGPSAAGRRREHRRPGDHGTAAPESPKGCCW